LFVWLKSSYSNWIYSICKQSLISRFLSTLLYWAVNYNLTSRFSRSYLGLINVIDCLSLISFWRISIASSSVSNWGDSSSSIITSCYYILIYDSFIFLVSFFDLYCLLSGLSKVSLKTKFSIKLFDLFIKLKSAFKIDFYIKPSDELNYELSRFSKYFWLMFVE